MSFSDPFQVLRNQLVTMVNRPATVWDNVELPANPPYLIVEIVPLTHDTVAHNYAEMKNGIFQVTVVTESGIGSPESEAIAQRVADCFPAGWKQDGVIVTHPASLVQGYPNNGLWRLPVQIRWRVLPG